MHEPRLRGPDGAIALLGEAQAQVHVVEGDRKSLLVEAAHLVELGFGDGHAGGRHRARLSPEQQPVLRAGGSAGRPAELVSRHPLRAHAQHDAGMLGPAVGIEQLGPDCAHRGVDRQRDHRLQPVRLGHHHVVVDEHQHRRARRCHGGIVQSREVERRVDAQHAHPGRRGQPIQHVQGSLGAAAVVDDADLQSGIVGLFQQAGDAGFEQARPVARGDDGQHLWRRIGHGPADDEVPSRTRIEPGGAVGPFKMVVDQAHPRRIDLRPRALREAVAAGVDPPVVEHMRDVQDRAPPRLDDAQHQIVILRPIQARSQAAQLAQQIQPDREGMVDIVLGEQALTVELGLEHGGGTAPVGVQGVLVRIDGHGVRPLGEGRPDHGQGMRRQGVVVIQEQRDVALRQGQRRVAGRHDAAGCRQSDSLDARIAVEAPNDPPDIFDG